MLDATDALLIVDKSKTLILPLSSCYIAPAFDFCNITEKLQRCLDDR